MSLYEDLTEILTPYADKINQNTASLDGLRDDLDNLDVETDKTLSVDGKPADAKAVGDEVADLKADLNDMSFVAETVKELDTYDPVHTDDNITSTLETGKYYSKTNLSIGSIIATDQSNNVNYDCGLFEVNKGDVYVVTGETASTSNRIWCFTDANYKLLSGAELDSALILKDEVITAPANGYLFINVRNNYVRKIIKRTTTSTSLHEKITEIVDNIPKWIATNILGGGISWDETERTVTGTGSSDFIVSTSAYISSHNYSLDGDVIYLSAMVKASGNPTKLTLSHGDTSPYIESGIQNLPTADTWYRLSSIDRQVSITVLDYRFVGVRAYYADPTAQNGQTLTYKCGLAFNLTTIFGKGNEPTDPTIIDAMLSQYENGWFSGSQDIWNPLIIKWLAESYKSYMNGTYYGSDGKRFTAGSIIDRNDDQWNHAQAGYGLSAKLVPVDNKFEGGIRTNGMVNVFPKYGRWERGAAGTDVGSLFGGHVFEAWNNIRSYRLTMMMGHGGDEVSYTDENGVVHKTPREDEACIIVYSPANSYAEPPITPTEEQSKLRINKAREDYYGENAQNLLGRVRIGGDTPTQGTVFTKNKMITYGRIILADTTRVNTGKALKFNSDGTVTWEEVTLYQNPEPAPVE